MKSGNDDILNLVPEFSEDKVKTFHGGAVR